MLVLLKRGAERRVHSSPQECNAQHSISLSFAAEFDEVEASDLFSNGQRPPLRANIKSAITRRRPSPDRATRHTMSRAADCEFLA